MSLFQPHVLLFMQHARLAKADLVGHWTLLGSSPTSIQASTLARRGAVSQRYGNDLGNFGVC